MRSLVGVVVLVMLAGCQADGSPDAALWKAAAEGFARGYGDGPDPVPPTPLTPLMQFTPPQTTGSTAVWTGRSAQVQTVSGRMAWQCEYNYAGQTFSLLFEAFCPSSTLVQ
jgi:hypothetical protein